MHCLTGKVAIVSFFPPKLVNSLPKSTPSSRFSPFPLVHLPMWWNVSKSLLVLHIWNCDSMGYFSAFHPHVPVRRFSFTFIVKKQRDRELYTGRRSIYLFIFKYAVWNKYVCKWINLAKILILTATRWQEISWYIMHTKYTIYKTKVLLPQALVALADFVYPV